MFFDWLNDWLIDWPTDRLTNLLTDWLIACLIDWLIGWLLYLVLNDNTISDGLIKHLLVPINQSLVFGNLLFHRVTMKNVVISFTRRARPYMSNLIPETHWTELTFNCKKLENNKPLYPKVLIGDCELSFFNFPNSSKIKEVIKMVIEHLGGIFKRTIANCLCCSKINPFFHFSKPFSRLSIIETFCKFTCVNKVFSFNRCYFVHKTSTVLCNNKHARIP